MGRCVGEALGRASDGLGLRHRAAGFSALGPGALETPARFWQAPATPPRPLVAAFHHHPQPTSEAPPALPGLRSSSGCGLASPFWPHALHPISLERQDRLAELNSCSETTAKERKCLWTEQSVGAPITGERLGVFSQGPPLDPARPRRQEGGNWGGGEGGRVGSDGSRRWKRRLSGTRRGSETQSSEGETVRGWRCRAGAAGQRRGGKRDRQVASQDGGQPETREWLTTSALSEARIARFNESQSSISHPDWVWPLLAPWSSRGTPTSTLQESPI